MFSDITHFEAYITHIACRLAPDDAIHDTDDYCNELRFAAWRACERQVNVKFVRAAIWNRARDLLRRNKVHLRVQKEAKRLEAALPEGYTSNLDRVVDFRRALVQSPEKDIELFCRHASGESLRSLAPEMGYSDWVARKTVREIKAAMY